MARSWRGTSTCSATPLSPWLALLLRLCSPTLFVEAMLPHHYTTYPSICHLSTWPAQPAAAYVSDLGFPMTSDFKSSSACQSL